VTGNINSKAEILKAEITITTQFPVSNFNVSAFSISGFSLGALRAGQFANAFSHPRSTSLMIAIFIVFPWGRCKHLVFPDANRDHPIIVRPPTCRHHD
jgi:hypothetical protein